MKRGPLADPELLLLDGRIGGELLAELKSLRYPGFKGRMGTLSCRIPLGFHSEWSGPIGDLLVVVVDPEKLVLHFALETFEIDPKVPNACDKCGAPIAWCKRARHRIRYLCAIPLDPDVVDKVKAPA